MGTEWSCFPSARRNTLCCYDVRTQQPFWYTPPEPHISYRAGTHRKPPTRPAEPNYDIPANMIDFNAVVQIYAPVDTDSMIAQSGWRPPSPHRQPM